MLDFEGGSGGRSASRALVASARRPHVSVEESRLVREHDNLDAVAEVELLEDVGDVCLDGSVADVELSADLGVREAAGDQAEHVELALRQLVELFWRRGLWNASELSYDAFRDRGREKRLSAGNRADCG